MSTQGLTMSLASRPSHVLLRRGDDVADGLWHSLGRNISPVDSPQPRGDELELPLERLLASRNWLAATLTDYGCSVALDVDITEAFARQEAESDEVEELLRSEPVDDVDDRLAWLSESRFSRTLKEFQRRDLARLLTMSHGANFSVPGAGKTTVAYASYEALRTQGRVAQLLVVGPLSAFGAWMSEALACMEPAPRVARLEDRAPIGTEVLLVNYQRLVARYGVLADWVRRAPTQIILDEAHRMKRGRDGEWGAACLDLAYLASRRDVLTGTPAPQHPSDFVALFDFLWPNQAARILPRSALTANPTSDDMRDVSQRIRPLFVRTRKDELGLNSPKLRVELCSMKPLQQEIYDALRTRMRLASASAGAEGPTLARMGAVTMYLLQAASNPGLLAPALGAKAGSDSIWPSLAVPAGSTLGETIRRYGEFETPTKFDKLAALVAEHARDGRKTLVWSNFVNNLEGLATTVLSPYEPAVIHGSVPSSDEPKVGGTRESELARFRSDPSCMVLLANPAAMSEGVSLHDVCHDAVYVDRTFNAGQYLQSLDRIHRLGLRPGVETRITFLASQLTVDDVVDARIRLKAERLSRMLEDENLVTMALPDEESYGDLIDAEDLDALFAHLKAGE